MYKYTKENFYASTGYNIPVTNTPSYDGTIIDRIKVGTKVEVFGFQGNYAMIDLTGKHWVNLRDIKTPRLYYFTNDEHSMTIHQYPNIKHIDIDGNRINGKLSLVGKFNEPCFFYAVPVVTGNWLRLTNAHGVEIEIPRFVNKSSDIIEL